MFVGAPNPNILMPLEKMRITNLDDASKSPGEVLYNPQSYVQRKNVDYSQIRHMGSDAPVVQFHSGGAETLSFELFFDGVSSGAEVGGDKLDRLKFAGNSLVPSAAALIDVRDYTEKITDLIHIHDDVHRPPKLKLEWSTLQFVCFLSECTTTFTKFNELGTPVRARMQCTFIEYVDMDRLFSKHPLHSPDTTKYHSVRQGDSLWAIAAQEYGDAGAWRAIARANGISNPRSLHPGDLLVIPALV
jgi:hypothetical protein